MLLSGYWSSRIEKKKFYEQRLKSSIFVKLVPSVLYRWLFFYIIYTILNHKAEFVSDMNRNIMMYVFSKRYDKD